MRVPFSTSVRLPPGSPFQLEWAPGWRGGPCREVSRRPGDAESQSLGFDPTPTPDGDVACRGGTRSSPARHPVWAPVRLRGASHLGSDVLRCPVPSVCRPPGGPGHGSARQDGAGHSFASFGSRGFDRAAGQSRALEAPRFAGRVIPTIATRLVIRPAIADPRVRRGERPVSAFGPPISPRRNHRSVTRDKYRGGGLVGQEWHTVEQG